MTFPLKIDGWKMKQGTFVRFPGCRKSFSDLKFQLLFFVGQVAEVAVERPETKHQVHLRKLPLWELTYPYSLTRLSR